MNAANAPRPESPLRSLLVFTILAVAIIPLASVQFRSRTQISEAERQSQAVQIAQAMLERTKMRGFNNAQPDTLVRPPFVAISNVVPDAANPFLQEIQVSVNWSYGAEPRALTIATKQAAR